MNSYNKMSTNTMNSSVLMECTREICLYFNTGEISEVDFMPTTSPPYVLVESKVLGVSYGLLKPLYKHVYTELLRIYGEYKDSRGDDSLLLQNMLDYSTVALVVKGDLAIAYNIRKEVLSHNPTLLSKEITFLQAIFSKHPKSPAGWEHRRWCLLLRHSTLPPVPENTHTNHPTPKPPSCHSKRLSPSEVETERELCRASSERSPKNYWAWTHRLWLLRHMTLHQFDDELGFVLNWLSQHISDHSAVQHFIQLLSCILQHPNSREILNYIHATTHKDEDETKEVYKNSPKDSLEGPQTPTDSEISQAGALSELQRRFLHRCWRDVQRLLVKRPGHESLWSARKGLLSLILAHCNRSGVDLKDEALWNSVETELVDLGRLLFNWKDPKTSSSTVFPLNSIDICDLPSLVLSDIRFVYQQVLVALCENELGQVVWDATRQVATALRYLVFAMRRVFDKHRGVRMGVEEGVGLIVRYLEEHDSSRSLLAYYHSL